MSATVRNLIVKMAKGYYPPQTYFNFAENRTTKADAFVNRYQNDPSFQNEIDRHFPRWKGSSDFQLANKFDRLIKEIYTKLSITTTIHEFYSRETLLGASKRVSNESAKFIGLLGSLQKIWP